MQNSTEISINSSQRTYSILVGENNLSDLPSVLIKDFAAKKVFIVSDEYVLSIYKDKLKKIFDPFKSLKSNFFSLPQGEKTKSNEKVQVLYSWLIENKCDRHSIIVAFGGGVIGDAVGFVASTFLRGIRLVQVPTTLLSMVDSSVGGKVGINHEQGKNLIGAFYPPHLVIQDISLLSTLKKREFSAGLAECVKHSLISSKSDFEWTFDNRNEIFNSSQSHLSNYIRKNILIKANVVEKDEKEIGIRAFLNFGHTFGHAIEKEYGYSNKVLHGEGVSLGMIAALKISEYCFNLDPNVLNRTRTLLNFFSLPTKMKLPPLEKLLESMSRDKKNRSDHINFVLLSEIGSPILKDGIDQTIIEDAYNFINAT